MSFKPHTTPEYDGNWTKVKSTSKKPSSVSGPSYTRDNNVTVIHGNPNVAMKMREGEYSVDRNKPTTNTILKKPDTDLRKLDGENPQLTYVCHALAVRMATGRSEYQLAGKEKKGITQQELANMLGNITLAEIKMYESTSNPAVYNSKVISRICSKLGVSPKNE